MSKKLKLYTALMTGGLILGSCSKNKVNEEINKKDVNPAPIVQSETSEPAEKAQKLEELFNKKLEETRQKHGKRIKKETNEFMDKLNDVLNSRLPAWILEKNISNHSAYDGSPSIDNSGRVAFESKRTGNLEIFLYDAKTKALTQITDNKRADQNPLIAGNCIVFESIGKNSQDIHGYFLNQEQLINISNHKNSDFQPSLSRDGKKITFITTRNNKFQLMAGDKESLKSLDYDSSLVMNPSIAGNGTIAFESLKDGRREIYAVDSEGKTKNISQNPEDDYNPNISNFGNRIVFESLRYGNNSICIYDNSLRKVKKLDIGSNPVISGDGSVIVYQKPTKDGKQEICAVKLNNALEIIASGNISYNRANDTNAAISPNGKMIAFTSDREGNQDVYTLSLEKILK